MTEIQRAITAKYTGVKELETLDSGEKHNYHIFQNLFDLGSIKEIKIRYDNPVISGILKRAPEILKLGNGYELTWNEKENQPKRVFDKGDVIVLV